VPPGKAWYAKHIKDVFDSDGKQLCGYDLNVLYAWLFICEKGFPPGTLGIVEIRATI